jgi:hypothetical protein
MNNSAREKRKLEIVAGKKRLFYRAENMIGKTSYLLRTPDNRFRIESSNKRINALNEKHADFDSVYRKLNGIIDYEHDCFKDRDYDKFVFCVNYFRERISKRIMIENEYLYIFDISLSDLRENCRKISEEDHFDIHDGKISLVDKLKN